MLVATPTKRAVRPTAIIGRTWTIFGKMLSEVRLPSMLKSTSWPKIQTPPKTPSVSCRTLLSAIAAKHVPVTMTSNSGWNKDPKLKPMGINTLPFSAAPRPNAISATARTMRKPSTAAPVKICRPFKVGSVRRGTTQPLEQPSKAPNVTVATIRNMLAKTTSFMSTCGAFAGSARPTRMPKSVSTKDASSGAQQNISLGSGCPLNAIPNSFIFGMTSPSPMDTRTTPNTKLSILVKRKAT
mmetsp:Transcript_59080/g.117014  ORF Transcript_59080/g.117014 Transcript_59080/m.117014 type:complete len:240 (+) Transcript_59080:245-964(+)